MRKPYLLSRPHVDVVFTTGPKPTDYTYIDRADLDERLKSADRAGMHVAIHGESKHGKTWLRSRQLRDEATARTQCTPGMTADGVIAGALGTMGVYEPIKLTGSYTVGQTAGASAVVGHGPASATLSGSVAETESSTLEQLPVGQHAKDLGWVAQQFRAAKRRPVFEDFHNLAPAEQRRMAFAIKALGDWEVPCVVAGIWPDQPLLTYYNGELDGRIEDLHVTWTGAELDRIVQRGCRVLNVTITAEIQAAMRRDAYTSAGLIQQLALELLREAKVGRRPLRRLDITNMDLYRTSRDRVATRIATRFNPFVDNFCQYEPDGLRPRAFAHLLAVVIGQLDDADLLDGIAVPRVLDEMTVYDPQITREDLVRVLGNLPEAHQAAEIQPTVLAFDRPGDRLTIVDRRLLLYRRRYSRTWPWAL